MYHGSSLILLPDLCELPARRQHKRKAPTPPPTTTTHLGHLTACARRAMAVAAEDDADTSAPAGATSSSESQSRGLSPEDMRATWSVVDVLTSLKRRTSHPPTAALIRRKIDALSLPARDTLGFLVDFTIAKTQGQLSPRQVGGMALAVRRYPDDTATEVAHVHARCEVVSAAAVEAVRFESSHLLCLGTKLPGSMEFTWRQSQPTVTQRQWLFLRRVNMAVRKPPLKSWVSGTPLCLKV